MNNSENSPCRITSVIRITDNNCLLARFLSILYDYIRIDKAQFNNMGVAWCFIARSHLIIKTMNTKQAVAEYKYKQLIIKKIERVVFYLIVIPSSSYFLAHYIIYLIK